MKDDLTLLEQDKLAFELYIEHWQLGELEETFHPESGRTKAGIELQLYRMVCRGIL